MRPSYIISLAFPNLHRFHPGKGFSKSSFLSTMSIIEELDRIFSIAYRVVILRVN